MHKWMYDDTQIGVIRYMNKRKKGDLTQSYDTTPLYQQKIRKPKYYTQTPPKLRLHNDCGPT